MAGFVLDANQVGQVITYVAPGFFAQLGYRARYPGGDRPAGEVFIVSVATSLPLVALANALLDGSHKADQLPYVLALTLGALVVGYGFALLRGIKPAKQLLGRLGYRIEPEGSIYAQTLKKLSPAVTVLIELKDGRRVEGTPRNGPEHEGDGINELYLTNPRACGKDGEWYSVGAGLIVPLGEVSHIVLPEDPTNASTEPAATASERLVPE